MAKTTKTKPATHETHHAQAHASQDEGEPQTVFLSPHQGGSYRRNPDGSLTRVCGTEPPHQE